jgi:hypothetical protein
MGKRETYETYKLENDIMELEEKNHVKRKRRKLQQGSVYIKTPHEKRNNGTDVEANNRKAEKVAKKDCRKTDRKNYPGSR